MNDFFFNTKHSFSEDESLVFLIGFKKAELKLVSFSILSFISFFFIGLFLSSYGVKPISVFFGFLTLSIGLTIQVTKYGQILDANEQVVIKNIKNNTIIEIIKSKHISEQRKKMILALIPKRKLEYCLKYSNNKDVINFLNSVIVLL